MQDIVYPIADLIQWTFGLLELADNYPNILIVALGAVGLVLWMLMQRRYNQIAKENGTIA